MKFLEQERIETDALRHLCLCHTGVTFTFFDILSESTKLNLLKYFSEHQMPKEMIQTPNMQTSDHIRWCLKCFTSNTEKNENLEKSLFFYELETNKSKQAKEFYRALIDVKNSPTNNSLHRLITAFYKFFHSNMSFASIFIPEISKYAEQYGTAQVCDEFGLETLVLFKAQSFLDITFAFQTQEDFEYLFQFPDLPNEIHTFFQTCFTSDYAFPLTSFVSYTPMLSALNTCATTTTFFVDIISSVAESQFKAHDKESCWNTCLITDDLSPWVFISFLRRTDIWNAVKGLPDIRGTDIASDFIQRVQSDLTFFEAYKRVTGNVLNPATLEKQSIPYVLAVPLDNFMVDDFIESLNSHLFVVSDENLSIDRDFVCYFLAVGYTLRLIKGEIEIDESSQIEGFIENIRDEDVKQQCLIDLFSLLFLKDKNGELVCSLITAECISMIILNSTDNQSLLNYVRVGHGRIQTEQFSAEGGLLSKCFINKVSQINNAINIHDYEIAEHIAGNNPKLRELIDTHRTVHEFKEQKMTGFNGEGMAALEIGLSFEEEYLCLQRSQSIEVCEECKKLLDERIIKKGANNLLISKPLNMQNFSLLAQKLLRTGASTWTTNSCTDKTAPLLYSFFSYLDSLIPPILESNISQTVFDCLKIDRRSMVSKLLMNVKVDEARKIANLFKFDLVNFVFEKNNFPYESIAKFTDNSVPVINAYAINSNWNDSDLSKLSPKVLKFIKRKRTQSTKKDLQELEGEEFLDNIANYTQEEIKKALVSLIDEKQFNKKEYFEEISFVLIDFSSVIWSKINNRNIDALIKATENCVFDEDILVKLSFLEGIKDPFPIDETAKNLLKENCFEKVLSMLKVFPEIQTTVMKYSRIAPPGFFDVFLQIPKPEPEKKENKLSKSKKQNIDTIIEKQKKHKTFIEFATSIKALSKTFDDFPLLFDFVVEETAHRMKLLNVYERCLDSLSLIVPIIKRNTKQTDTSKKIIAIYDILEQELEYKYNFAIEVYTDFESQSFGRNLLNSCIKYDIPNAEAVINTWGLDIEEYKPQIFNRLVSMSFFEESVPFITNTEEAIVKLSHAQIFNKDNYENITDNIKKISQGGYTMTETQKEIINNLINSNCEKSFIVKYHIINNELEDAINALNNDNSLVISSLLASSVEYSRLEGIKKVLIEKGEEGRDILTKIHSYAAEKKLLHLKLDLEQLLGFNKEAALTSISLFCQKGFTQQSFGYLDLAQAVLTRELHTKKDDEIAFLVESIKYQRLFSVFLTRHNLFGFSDLNVFDSQQSRKSIVILLFKSYSFDLAIKIMNHYSIDSRSVGKALADALIAEENAINEFFVKMQDLELFHELSFVILTRVWYLFSEKEKVLFIVNNIINDQEYKCKLYIEFDKLEAAFEVAKKANLRELVPTIANHAFHAGNIEIYNKSIKFLL